jgi:hypothetical protein
VGAQAEGYITFILASPNSLIGIIIGAFTTSLFVIAPAIMKWPTEYIGFQNRLIFSSDPIKATGIITNIISDEADTKISVSYNSTEHEFNLDNRALNSNLSQGDSVTVFYENGNPEKAYLDFYSKEEKIAPNKSEQGTLFKLIDITPRFDLSDSLFELTGELHGGDLQGRKVSIMHGFDANEIHNYTPGKLFPCSITGSDNDYKISLIIN